MRRGLDERGFVTYDGSLYLAFGLIVLAGLLAGIGAVLVDKIPVWASLTLLRTGQLVALAAFCCAARFGWLILVHIWNTVTGKYKR